MVRLLLGANYQRGWRRYEKLAEYRKQPGRVKGEFRRLLAEGLPL